MPNHYYTLLWARHIDGHRLIKLRNPHGGGKEWDGDWGDDSHLWTAHPDVASAAGFEKAADGVFFMCLADLAAVFEKIAIWGEKVGS